MTINDFEFINRFSIFFSLFGANRINTLTSQYSMLKCRTWIYEKNKKIIYIFGSSFAFGYSHSFVDVADIWNKTEKIICLQKRFSIYIKFDRPVDPVYLPMLCHCGKANKLRITMPISKFLICLPIAFQSCFAKRNMWNTFDKYLISFWHWISVKFLISPRRRCVATHRCKRSQNGRRSISQITFPPQPPPPSLGWNGNIFLIIIGASVIRWFRLPGSPTRTWFIRIFHFVWQRQWNETNE